MTTINLAGFRCRPHQRNGALVKLRLIVQARDGLLYERTYTQELPKQPVVSEWREARLPLAVGMHCEMCIREGQNSLIEDDFDYIAMHIGDIIPFVLVASSMVNAEVLADKIEERFGASAYRTQLPAVQPTYADWSKVKLHPVLLASLRQRILPSDAQLYAFQAEAIASILAGRDTIVTTPTASGKTLAYLLPALHTIMSNPASTVLYISPLNALTEDQLDAICRFDESNNDWNTMASQFGQYRTLRTIQIGTHEITVCRYDGTAENRQAIKLSNPHIVMTNPDMLHIGIMTNSYQWQRFFSNLKYIVIDEVHTYRGVVGSSMANVLRRLLAICKRYGSNPVLVCASATIANTAHVLRTLTGREFYIVDGGNSAPQRERTMLVRSAAIEQGDDSNSKRPRQSLALVTLARQMLTALYDQRIRTILFGRSINEINDVQRILKDALQLTDAQQSRIQTYRRELAQSDKMRILQEMRNGKMHMILSTTALSMGIDIGNISAVVIAGFPGSIAEFWQQAGRAGRSGQGLIVFLASVDAQNQFFARNPDALFNLRAQPMFLNPDNTYIVRRHMIAHIKNGNVSVGDIQIFGVHATNVLQQLIDEGQVVVDNQTQQINLQNKNMHLTGLRDIDGTPVKVMVGTTELATVDQSRAMRALHYGAIYMVQYEYYEVVQTNWQQESVGGNVKLQLIPEPEYMTDVMVESTVEPMSEFENGIAAPLLQFIRQVKITSQAIGYMKHPIRQRQQKSIFRPLDPTRSPTVTVYSHGLRMTLHPMNFRQTLASNDVLAAQTSMLIALRLAISIEQLCDVQDIDYTVIGNLSTNTVTQLWFFDTASGGIGICEAVWQNPLPVLTRAHAILAKCPHCSEHPESRGCAYCAVPRYGDETTINRQVAMVMLEELMAAVRV